MYFKQYGETPEQSIAKMPLGQREQLRRMVIFYTHLKNKRWSCARKWARICGPRYVRMYINARILDDAGKL